MKTGLKNIFSLKMALAIMLVAVLGLSVFVGVGLGKKQYVFAEAESTTQEISEEENSQTETSIVSDVSSYESWGDYVEDPTTKPENMGSISTRGKEVVITEPGELAWIASMTNSGNSTYSGFSGWTIHLQADITLAGKIWTPIGSSSTYAFKGKFNGNGHKITGLTFESSSTLGLFNYCNSARIYDVIIENCVNVSSNALWSGNGTSTRLLTCYSSGVTLTKGESTMRHCVSGSENKTIQATLAGKPASLNSITSEVKLQQGSSTPVSKVSNIHTASDTKKTYTVSGLDKYTTIKSITIFSWDAHNAWWTEGKKIEWDDDAKRTAANGAKVTFKYEYADVKEIVVDYPSTVRDVTVTIKAPHQHSAYALIETEGRQFKIEQSVYSLTNLAANTSNHSLLSSQYNVCINNEYTYYSVFTKMSTIPSGLTKDGSTFVAEAWYAFTDNNKSITYSSKNISGVYAMGLKVAGVGQQWSTTNSKTIELSESNVKESGGYLVVAIDVYLFNAYKINLQHATARLSGDKVFVNTGANSSYFAFKFNDIAGQATYSRKLIHNVEAKVSGLTGIAAVYFSRNNYYNTKDSGTNVTQRWLGDALFKNEGITGSSPLVKNAQNATTNQTHSSWAALNDGDTLYCSWALQYIKISLKTVIRGAVQVEVVVKNPYLDVQTEFSPISTKTTTTTKTATYNIPATFIVKISDANEINGPEDINMVIGPDNIENNNKIKLGSAAIVEAGKWSEANITNGDYYDNPDLTRWAFITIFSSGTYEIYAKTKEVKFQIDVVVNAGSKNSSDAINGLSFSYSYGGSAYQGVTLSNASTLKDKGVSGFRANYSMSEYMEVSSKFQIEIRYNESSYESYYFSSLKWWNTNHGVTVDSNKSSNDIVVFEVAYIENVGNEIIPLVLCIDLNDTSINDDVLVYDCETNVKYGTTLYDWRILAPSENTGEYGLNASLVTTAIRVRDFKITADNFEFLYNSDTMELTVTKNNVGLNCEPTRVGSKSGYHFIVTIVGDFQIVIAHYKQWKADGDDEKAIHKGDDIKIKLVLPEYKENGYTLSFGCEAIDYELTLNATYNTPDEGIQNSSTPIDSINCNNSPITVQQIIGNVIKVYGPSGDIGQITHRAGYYPSALVAGNKSWEGFEAGERFIVNDINCLNLLKYWFNLEDSDIELSIDLTFDPLGVDLNILGHSGTKLLAEANQVVESYIPGTTVIEDIIINHYSFVGYSFTAGGDVNNEWALCKYEALYNMAENNIVNVYANYMPTTYLLNFINQGSEVFEVTTSIESDVYTIQNILSSATQTDYLQQFVRAGYDLTFVVDGLEFDLSDTTSDIIASCGKNNGALSQEIDLVATYSSKDIQFDYKLEGDSTGVGLETYSFSSAFGEDIEWSDKLSTISEDLLEHSLKVIGNWYIDFNENQKHDNNEPILAIFDSYSVEEGRCVYNYTDWKPTEYKERYTIVGECSNNKTVANFNGAYLSDKTDAQADVAFGTILPDIANFPYPIRTGYTFAYWKAVDSRGVEYYIYGPEYATETNSLVTTFDSVLNFYAYWDVNEIEFEYGSYQEEYDAQAHVIELISLNNVIPDVDNKMELYNENDELVASSINTGILTYTAKYVDDSGSFYAIYTYSIAAADSTNPASEYYLNSSYTTLKSEALADVRIIPKQLTIDEITKQYDGTTNIIQEIIGVEDVDKNEYKISARYESVNVAENIGVEYSVTCSNLLIKNSYAAPETVEGNITPREIIVNLSGDIRYSGQDDENIIVAKGVINDTGAVIILAEGQIEFVNEADIAALLTEDRELSFVIKTNNSAISVFDAEDYTIELLESNGQNSTDFVITINEATFQVSSLLETQRSFTFYAVIHEEHTNVETYDISDYVYNITMAGARKISDHSFNIMFNDVNVGDTLSFAISVDFKDANWWLLDAIILNKETGAREVVLLNLFEDGISEYTLTATTNKVYDVFLQFTNVSRITYELGYIDASEMNNIPDESAVEYGAKFILPTPSRKGLTFSKWFYIDGAGQQTFFDNTTIDAWSIKGDVTVYALWDYVTTINIVASDIDAAYSPDKFYNLSAINIATTNYYLEYSHIWKKSNTLNGVYVPLEDSDGSIELHNTSDSGYYTFEFNILNIPIYLDKYPSISLDNVTIVNNGKFSVKIYENKLTLLNIINKQYDGEVDYLYEITKQDVQEVYEELVGQKVVITYSSADVGASVVSVVAHEDSVIAKNYSLHVQGNIVVKEIEISIGEIKQQFNSNYASYKHSDIILTTIQVSNIVISTNSINKGLYSQNNNNLVVEFDPVLIKSNQSIDKSFFKFIINGSIEITAKGFEDGDIEIVWTKVYNMQKQNVSVYVYGKLINDYYNVKQNNSTFAGATAAGTYNDITVTINYPNHIEYVASGDFEINPYVVYIDVLNNNISKTYDGTVNLKTLVNGTDYVLYDTIEKNNLIDSDHNANINRNGLLWFVFGTPSAGKNKQLIPETSSSDYTFHLINLNMKGNILQKDIVLTVNVPLTKIFDGNGYEVDVDIISTSGLVYGDELSGSIFINVVDAGSYNLGQVDVDSFKLNDLTIGDSSFTQNYNLVQVVGNLTINKADIDVVITPNQYVYTAKVQDVKFIATRNSDYEDVTDILFISVNNGVSVGTNTITLQILDEHAKNYNYTSKSYSFEIIKKEVVLNIDEAKVYDGTKFKYYLAEKYDELLCAGHTFGRSYIETVNTYALEYSTGLLNRVVDIYDGNNQSVLSNYNITYNDKLTIGKTTITDADIVKADRTYNGEIQEIGFAVLGEKISFEGNIDYGTNAFEYRNGDIKIQVKFVLRTNGEDDENAMTADFKYVGIYRVTMSSNIFFDFSFNLVINPKIITSFTAQTTKVYDGTTEVTDVSTDQIYEGDKNFVKLVGEYGAVFGQTEILVNLLFENYENQLSYITFGLLKGSYVLDENLTLSAEIVAREITLNYTPKYEQYYRGEKLALEVINEFTVENMVNGEVLAGTIEFSSIVNAGEYDLSLQDANLSEVQVTGPDYASIEHYIVTVKGSVKINKAQLVVSIASNLHHVYSDESKTAQLTANIYESRGAIPAGLEIGILYANYKTDINAGFVDAIDAGLYYIYPKVNEHYEENFEYVGDIYLTDKVEISKRDIEFTANKEIVYSETKNYFEFWELDTRAENIVSGHRFNGTLTIDPYAANTSYHYTGELTSENVVLTAGPTILKGNGIDVTVNYNFTYNITIVVVETVGDGQFRATSKQKYEYNSLNRMADIEFVFEIGVSGQVLEQNIYINSSSDYAQVVAFYANITDAQNDTNRISEIKNVGEYFARIAVDITGNKNFESTSLFCISRVEIIAKTIKRASLTYNGNAFIGVREFNNSDTIILESSDVYEVDKGTIEIKAVYYTLQNDLTANVNANCVVKLFMSTTSEYVNYVLDTVAMDGAITKKTITVVKYNADADYYYQGIQTISIDASKFDVDGLLDEHKLIGNISLDILNAGEYLFVNGTNYLGVKQGDKEISYNYIINISDDIKFVVQKAIVEISWSGLEYTYTSLNLTPEIIKNLDFSGNYLAGVTSDLVVKFINSQNSIVDIIAADTYDIDETSLASNSGNFQYKVSTTSSKIVVNKKDITIALGLKEVKWKEYNIEGYNLTYNMISGGYPADKEMFELGVYKILGQHKANKTYLAQLGTNNANIEYSSIQIEYAETIANNYNCTQVFGGIKILPEVITFEAIAPLTYNGQNRYSEIEIVYFGEDGIRKTILGGDTTNGSITAQEIVNAGRYTLEVIINTAIYNLPLVVNPKLIAIIDYQENKQYDGSDIVYNSENKVNLTSPDVISGDDIVINGTYAGYMYSEQAYAITFTKAGLDSDNYILQTNHHGKILQRKITFNFGIESLSYQLNSNYQVYYKGSTTIIGGEITSKTLKFSLNNNEVNSNLAITTENATLNFDEFKIEKDGKDVTACYEITIQLTVNIIAKEFVVEFLGYENNKVVFDASEKRVSIKIADNGVELTEEELNTIMSAIMIEYKDVVADDVLATGIYPIDAGEYVATAVYSGTNCFEMVGNSKYAYSILKFTYNVGQDEIHGYTKEYATADPDLSQVFTQDFDGVDYIFTITYAREAGENIGKYDLLLTETSCDSKNINFVCDSTLLAEKFVITKNTSSIVKITINSYNNGDFVRYYGFKNIGLFNITDFAYTTTVLDIEVNGGITSGTVLYNSGNVGVYEVHSCEIESTNFTRFEIQSNIQFEIKPRTLVISAENYNKPYDGTTTFVNELVYNYNTVSAEGIIAPEDISSFGEVVVAISYANADAGTHNLTANLSTNVNNFVVKLDTKTGTITPLDIEVNISNQTIIYGEAINLDYSVDAQTNVFTQDQLKSFVKIGVLNADKSSAGYLKVGIYNLSINASDNFNITLVANATLSIIQKEITVTISPKPYKVQDGTTEINLSDYQITIDGVINPDIVNVVSGNFENVEVGINKKVIFALGGTDSANYKAKSVYGDIGLRKIVFQFNYYGYEGCAVSGVQINSSTITVKTIEYDYYKSINEQNANSLPTPAFIGRGYEFVGWSLSNDITRKIDADKKISEYVTPYVESISVYAIWDIQKFNINIFEAKYNYQTNGYDIARINTVQEYYLTEVDVSAYSTNLLHYTYVGYGIGNTNKLFTTNFQITGEVDLYLVYALDKYTVVVDADGGVFSNSTTEFKYQSAGTLSFELYYGQKIGEKYTSSTLERYLAATKAGYTFNGWTVDNNIKTMTELAGIVVEADMLIIATWSANKYKLILNGQDGKFELTNEQLEQGWTYVNGTDQSTVQKEVEYQGHISRLVVPTKAYYAFAGYFDSQNQEWVESDHSVWTTLGDISLYATFADLDYTLSIFAENSTVSIIAKDSKGVNVNINNRSTETNKYVFTVKTSYSISITANANQGYTFTSFTDLSEDGYTVGNVYHIDSFKGDREIVVNVSAKENVITLKVNNNEFGYITVKLVDESGAVIKETTSNDIDPTFISKTGEAFIIEALASEGYKVGKWYVDGSGVLGELTSTQKILSKFTTDVVVYVEFEAKDINITIVNDEDKGLYIVGNTNYTTTQTVKAKTGQEVVIKVTANYGFDIDSTILEFVTESQNKGEIVVKKEGGNYIITLSKFTADGSITIPYITQKFTVTVGYAEYDEITGEITAVEYVNEPVMSVNGIEKAAGENIVEEYLTPFIVVPTYIKQGYTFYGYAELKANGFISIVMGIDGQNNLTFNLESDYHLFLVYQREQYTVTYKVNNINNGNVRYLDSENLSTEIVETIRFGRLSTIVEAVLIDEYRKFEGWYIGDSIVSNNLVLPATEITSDTIFEAKIAGTTQTFNIEIYANSTYEVAEDISSIVTSSSATIGAANQGLDAQDNIVIIVAISYEVGTDVDLMLNINSYYQAIKNSAAGDDYGFNLGFITPNDYNETTPFIVNLALRYYKVEITSEQEKAATFTSLTNDLSGESDFNPNGQVLAIAYLKYGSTLVVRIDINEGYTFESQEGNRDFVFNGDVATLENVTEDISIKFNFIKTQYKITFKTNYPSILLGTPIENIVNKEFTFYVEQDGAKLKNADGTNANLQELINAQTFIVENAVFKFDGWSVTETAGLLNTCYLFDEGGIYFMNDGVKTYGFNTCITVDENKDGVADVDNGYVVTYLYAAWSLPTYKLNIIYSPETVKYDNDYAIHFQNVMGLLFEYKGEDGATEDAIYVAEGVQVVMFTAPELSGYKYYGWKLSTENEIKQGYAEFAMPRNEVTIVLCYQFKVQLLVEEKIAGVNSATVNTLQEIWCLAGETLSFIATPGEGFVFKYWKQDGVELQDIGATFTITATVPTIYTAVFGGKEVEVILRNTEHTTLELGVVSEEVGTIIPIVNKVYVGDTIRIAVKETEYGFKLQAISINNSTNGITQNSAGNYYEYIIQQADGEAGKIYIDTVVEARQVEVKFETDITGACEVFVNGVDVTVESTRSYAYNDSINVQVVVQPRHGLLSVSINGQNVDLATSFVINLTQNNGFKTGELNTIKFDLERLYWIDVKQSLVGYGTKEAPYLISNAESLAYMAYAINKGLIDQSLNRLYYKVTAEIDLTERFWIPIGTEENPFDGIFILGKFNIIGASFAEQYYMDEDWGKYCPGVFGYVADSAKLETEQSLLPTIILLIVIGAGTGLLILIIVLVRKKKEEKVKRLSGNLGVSSVATPTSQKTKDNTISQQNKEKEHMDNQVQEILKQAEEKKVEESSDNISKNEEQNKPIRQAKKIPNKPDKKSD